MSAAHNKQSVLIAEWSPGVSKNPFLQFVVKGARAGDRIGVRGKDTRGAIHSGEAAVS